MREDGYGDPVNPAWSPDGAEIALDDNRGWIWLVKPDGADAKAILHGDSHVTPAVTADGSTVGSNSEIYVINVDGTRGSSA